MGLPPRAMYDIVALHDRFQHPDRSDGTIATRRLTPTVLTPSIKRQRLPTRKGTVVTSFALPRPLHQRLMIASVRLNWTLAQVLRDAAERWLVQHEPSVNPRAES